MKKTMNLSLVVLATLLMVSVSAKAQQKLSIGAKAEANTTIYKFDALTEFESSSPDFGGGAGVFFNYEFKNWFSLQADLLLQYRNSEMGNKITLEKSQLTSYDVELPVYAIFQAKVGTKRLFLGVGPYMGYGISAKFENTDMYDKDVSGRAPLHKLKYGAAAMLGFDFGHFQINATYISQNGIGQMRATSPIRSESVSLGVGYSF